jgi:hypothetical protein
VVRHERALADLFGEVLRLCGEAGLVKPEVIAIDGTRMAGSANSDATRDFGQIAKEILAEHKATDEAEDEFYGDARGDELPEQLQTPEGRREFFRQARQKLRRERTDDQEPADEGLPEPELVFDEERIVARTQGPPARPGSTVVRPRRTPTTSRTPAPPLGSYARLFPFW